MFDATFETADVRLYDLTALDAVLFRWTPLLTPVLAICAAVDAAQPQALPTHKQGAGRAPDGPRLFVFSFLAAVRLITANQRTIPCILVHRIRRWVAGAGCVAPVAPEPDQRAVRQPCVSRRNFSTS
jgi:hypothetical protein